MKERSRMAGKCLVNGDGKGGEQFCQVHLLFVVQKRPKPGTGNSLEFLLRTKRQCSHEVAPQRSGKSQNPLKNTDPEVRQRKGRKNEGGNFRT